MKHEINLTIECPYTILCGEVVFCVCEHRIREVLKRHFTQGVDGVYQARTSVEWSDYLKEDAK